MARRPWFVVILAVFHWLAPLGSILFSARLYHVTMMQAFDAALYRSTPVEFFVTFFLMPIAGFAIYAYKKWSYKVFVSISAISFYFNFVHWSASSNSLGLSTLLGTYALNLLIVSYFFIPRVRVGYFDPSLRWWESKPRFSVNIDAEVAMGSRSKKCQVTDLSEGGLFIRSTLSANLHDTVNIGFTFLGSPFNLKAKVAHVRVDSKKFRTFGYGLKFSPLDIEDEAKIMRVIRVLSLMKVTVRNQRGHWFEDFRQWVASLLLTGQGILPSYQGAHVPSPVVHKAGKREALRLVSKRKSPTGSSAVLRRKMTSKSA